MRNKFETASAAQVLGRLVWGESAGSRVDLPQASEADLFISHVSSGNSWLKALAICHHLNFNRALTFSVFTWLTAWLLMLCWTGSFGNLLVLGVARLQLILVVPPVVVFLLTYVGGHVLGQTTIWFDLVCVKDNTPFGKVETLQAIPTVVKACSEMLVVWDENFFERLWCNLEIAVFVKNFSPHAIHFVPPWLPLWMLATFGSFCFEILTGTAVSMMTGSVEEPHIGHTNHMNKSHMDMFIALFMHYFPALPTFIPTLMPLSWFCFQKLKSHRAMLDQMSHFDVRNAKCSLETDRVVIERHVVRLFDEALEAPVRVAFGAEDEHEELEDLQQILVSPESLEAIRGITSYPSREEILDEFNGYVRGPLRESVLECLGSELAISLKLCLAGNLPVIFAAPLYACDGQDACQAYVEGLGLGKETTTRFVWVNGTVSNVFLILTGIAIFPTLLFLNSLIMSKVNQKGWQLLCGTITAALVGSTAGLYLCLGTSVGLVTAAKFSWSWCAGLVALLCAEGAYFWLMFFKMPPKIGATRSLSRLSP